VGMDPRIAPDIRAALQREFQVSATELLVYPTNFACPSGVMRDAASGENSGISDVMSPWSAAVSEEMV
jgi:gamma-glutamyltranspeptidase / glutathione hydrolase